MTARSYRDWAEAIVGSPLPGRQWQRNNVSGAIETAINGGDNFTFFEGRFRERVGRLNTELDVADRPHLLDGLANIGSTKWFGCFAELAAWDFLSSLPFGLRVEVYPPGPQLGRNPAVLDGRLPGLHDLHFDVKILNDTTKEILESVEKQVEREHPGVSLSFNYSEDYSDDRIAEGRVPLLKAIENAIAAGERGVRYEPLGLLVHIHRPRPTVVVSETSHEPYRQAEARRYAMLGDAHQLLQDSKNVRVWVVHPWFNPTNAFEFAGSQEVFFRAVSRRVFVELTRDSQALTNVVSAPKCPPGVAVRDVAQRISGMIFLVDYTVAPARDRGADIPFNPSTPLGVVEAFVYANPNALPTADARYELELLIENAPVLVRQYEDFGRDNY